MLDENKNVTEASLEVAYESISQFIRDYRKMFGQSPKEDIKEWSFSGVGGKLNSRKTLLLIAITAVLWYTIQ